METCYKVFRRQVIQSIPIEEERFGFEPEITVKIAKRKLRIYEVGISYWGRTYEEGKKIGWRDGIRAFWCLLKYSVKEPAMPANSREESSHPISAARENAPEWDPQLPGARLSCRLPTLTFGFPAFCNCWFESGIDYPNPPDKERRSGWGSANYGLTTWNGECGLEKISRWLMFASPRFGRNQMRISEAIRKHGLRFSKTSLINYIW